MLSISDHQVQAASVIFFSIDLFQVFLWRSLFFLSAGVHLVISDNPEKTIWGRSVIAFEQALRFCQGERE